MLLETENMGFSMSELLSNCLSSLNLCFSI